MTIPTTLGPYASRDLLSSYDVANALNQLSSKFGTLLQMGLTHQEAVSTTFANAPDYINTVGYYTPGDFGNATYKKVTAFTTPLASTLSNPALNYNVGTFTTLDGSKYQMVPTSSDIYVNAFGARTNTSNNDLTYDSWQAFEDCKYFIIGNSISGISVNGINGSMKMRVAQGQYYLTRTHSVEGVGYDIYGASSEGSMIRFADRTHGFVTQHSWGNVATFEGIGSPAYTGGPLPVGSWICYPGSNRTYVVRTSGVVSSTAPTSTGTGITCGTAIVDYVRDLTWSEQTRAGAGNNVIADLTIWGGGNNSIYTQPAGFNEDHTEGDFAAGHGGAFHSGIVLRNRATVTRCFILGFPGHGVAPVANGDPDLNGSGNANDWRLDRVQCYWNGHDGIHVGGSDSNAGVGVDIDVSSNLRWGIADWSFLGNNWLSCESAFDGRQFIGGKFPGQCVHNGYWWLARVPAVGADPDPNYHNEPGTDPNSWQLMFGDGQAFPGDDTPIWNNTQTFVPNGAYSSNSINSVSIFLGMYIEGGTNPPQFSGRTSVFGGINLNNSLHGESLMDANVWSSGFNIAAGFANADGQSLGSVVTLGPNPVNSDKDEFASCNIFSIQAGGAAGSLDIAQQSAAPQITGSIADTVSNSAAFHGTIGLGSPADGSEGWSNILWVTSVESGTVVPGQDISGSGIPAGSKIGAAWFQPNTYRIWTGDGSTIGGVGGHPVGTLPGIAIEAMTSSTTLPVLTVTSAPTDAIRPGARLIRVSGTITGPQIKIAHQLDPTTLANITFTGGTGKYSLSSGGRTLSSQNFYCEDNGASNMDFAYGLYGDRSTHVWGWTGQSTKRKFGRANYVPNAFFARSMILGTGAGGMDQGGSRVVQYSSGPPDNGGDYKTGEVRFNNQCSVGQYPWYIFYGTDTGASGAPKWQGQGTVIS